MKASSIYAATLSLSLVFLFALFEFGNFYAGDQVKSDVYALDMVLRDLELLFRSELNSLWGEFHRELCESLMRLNGTSVIRPSSLWGEVLHLNGWGKTFYRRNVGYFGSEVEVRVDSAEVSSVSLDPAKLVWLYPKADVRTSPWEWVLASRWNVRVFREGVERTFSDFQEIPVPLRPKAHVESVLKFYEYVLKVPPLIEYETKILNYLPTHGELMGMAKELAHDALYGREGLSHYIDKGRSATEGKYVMRFAVFGNATWYYEPSNYNLSRSVRVSVEEEEGGECNVTYRATGYGKLELLMRVKLVGNATPINVYQIGCADCDAFFYRAAVERFRRAKLIYITEGVPEVRRERIVLIRVTWGVSEEAEGCDKDEVVKAVREAISSHLDSLEERVRSLLSEMSEEREKVPKEAETFLIPEDFNFKCYGS
ncbi:MAG: hypothetical protein QXP84_05310 [Candidatus Korarchaeum sp.]